MSSFGILHLKVHGPDCVACKIEALQARLAEWERRAGTYMDERDVALTRLAEAERLLCEAGDRIVYYTRGSTHYNGCELAHPDCKVLMEIGRLKNGMRPTVSAPAEGEKP